METPSMTNIRSAAQAPNNVWWRIFYLPSGYIVWVAARLGLSPNHLTIAAAAINVLGMIVIMACPLRTASMVTAYCIFFIAHTLDFSDGQLAKVTNQRSKQGAWLDSSLDVTKIAIVTACYFKIINGLPIEAVLVNVANIFLMGNLVNYSVSLASFAYRTKVDGYDSQQSPLDFSLSVYGFSGRLSRFFLSNIREYGNFIVIMLLFALAPRPAIFVLILWGAAQWLLAVNRIRYVARAVQSD